MTCANCGKTIKVIAFQGTDHCSTNCLKALNGEGLIPERIDA